MATVEVAPRAAADVDGILVDLDGHGGRAAAQRWQTNFVSAVGRIARHPDIGRPRPDIGPGLRSVLVHPHVLIYSYDRPVETVSVLRVLHARLKLPPFAGHRSA